MGKRREVIVTVGTTRFDKLVAGVDSESVKSALVRRGSESIFETLRLSKPLIVVGNEGLMAKDNHQTELEQELANRKHLFFVRGPHLLAQTIESMDLESIVPYTFEDEGCGNGISKSKAKKDAKKAEKAQKAAQRQLARVAMPLAGVPESDEVDPLSPNYGDISWEGIQSKYISGPTWTDVRELCADMNRGGGNTGAGLGFDPPPPVI
ncbi:UDP-N-acetylglucosamine transferase subunit ALG13 [Rhynchospora pubera]|uniref:UDP-N-acetylglucosamine transferase subunit ALG13 n=1 Tax=Rhynchospora pubera TaxID=906938 RepID=A0AAV8GX49_9POAL|nr:UDP-N-acetylglucosamine transferase subunit ALG13 [Rhynchospora pubera]